MEAGGTTCVDASILRAATTGGTSSGSSSSSGGAQQPAALNDSLLLQQTRQLVPQFYRTGRKTSPELVNYVDEPVVFRGCSQGQPHVARVLGAESWPSFPAGGVPQRLKANPSSSSTSEALQSFHDSPLCPFKTLRILKRSYYIVQAQLSAAQQAALSSCSDGILAGCLPLVVDAKSFTLSTAGLEGFVVFVTASGKLRMVHATYAAVGSYASRGQILTQGTLLEHMQRSGVTLTRGVLFCVLNTTLLSSGLGRLLFNIPCQLQPPAGSRSDEEPG